MEKLLFRGASMKPHKYIAVFGVLNALAFSVCGYSAHAAAKERTSHGGGHADTHMSAKGQDNTNAQWSADPERGWIRADERHDTIQQKQSTKQKKTRGKQANERKVEKN
jgi:hypothetical protein